MDQIFILQLTSVCSNLSSEVKVAKTVLQTGRQVRGQHQSICLNLSSEVKVAKTVLQTGRQERGQHQSKLSNQSIVKSQVSSSCFVSFVLAETTI
uniref:Uncharacterized protein n=1 Tax=Arundo donax TaxID=35708 RepID=A0A0A9HMJ2_ARUDO